MHNHEDQRHLRTDYTAPHLPKGWLQEQIELARFQIALDTAVRSMSLKDQKKLLARIKAGKR